MCANVNASRKAPLQALDICCGGGAVAQGLMDAGFEVTGIDNIFKHHKRYPGKHYIVGDLRHIPIKSLKYFDLIWASPPCQFASWATPRKTRHKHKNFIPFLRELFEKENHPYTIIENVPSKYLRKDVVLTGPSVGLFRIYRRRYFELSFFPGPMPQEQRLAKHAFSTGKAMSVTKNMSCSLHFYARKAIGLSGQPPIAEVREAMGIRHKMTGEEVGEAVPPEYARIIAERAKMLITGEPAY